MTEITKEPFGRTRDGSPVTRYSLRGDAGMLVRVLDYGCTIQSVLVPDRNGRPVDVVLGYDDLAGYEQGSSLFGAVVGRYANRIRGAAFTLDGREYTLSKNDGENHLHGTFEHRVFDASAADGALTLRYISPDGEEGYPGTLRLTVTYTLTGDNALVIDYRAVTDQPTVLNVTNHSYFNLSGEGSGDVLDQRLRLNADRFTEIGAGMIPTGRILPAGGTALDFREEKPIGRDMDADEGQMRIAGGYDHNLIPCEGELLCGAAYSPAAGITMEFSTTQPGVQLYTANTVHLDAAPFGKNGIRYPKHAGFCLESQHWPSSPAFPDFPATVLRPGEEFHESTTYRFLNSH